MLRTAIIAVLATIGLNLGAAAAAAVTGNWASPVGSKPIPEVVAEFSPPTQPWLAGHRGVDLAGWPGTEVRSAGAGTVGFVGIIAGRGVITVVHGDLRTTYEPVDAVVAPGQSVSEGQLIGRLSAGGHCSLRCLHWGLRRGDEYLDPMLLLGLRPPVLKPINPHRSAGRGRPTRTKSEPAVPLEARDARRPTDRIDRTAVPRADAQPADTSRSAVRAEGPSPPTNHTAALGAIAALSLTGGAALAMRKKRAVAKKP